MPNDQDSTNNKREGRSSSQDQDKGRLSDFITDEVMIQTLKKKGITKLFPIQYETFDLIKSGEDVVAKDRTGSGKTLAFSLPIIMKMRKKFNFRGEHKPKFLIVLPTRQLAIQVRDEILSLKLKDTDDFVVTAVYGGSGIQEQLSAIERGADIIVGTPGRLIDFLNRGALDLSNLETICLDQADEMLKIGFKEDIEKIFEFITKKRQQKVQCLLFSATIPEWIWQISDKYQSKSKKFIDMMKDSNLRTSKTVEHHCLKANPTDKEAYIGSILRHFLKGRNGKTIIFCETKREVDRIGSSGCIPLQVAVLHGDIKQFNRQRVFRKFKAGQIDCLIATNVAARGLDFPEIDLIIQMQPPPTTDTYIHRSGRTGRAGKSGICVTLFSYKEEQTMRKIQDETNINLNYMDTRDLPKDSNRRDDNSNGRDRDNNRDRGNQDNGRDWDNNRNNNRDNNSRDNNYRSNNNRDDNRDNYQRNNYRDNNGGNNSRGNNDRDNYRDNNNNRDNYRDNNNNRDSYRDNNGRDNYRDNNRDNYRDNNNNNNRDYNDRNNYRDNNNSNNNNRDNYRDNNNNRDNNRDGNNNNRDSYRRDNRNSNDNYGNREKFSFNNRQSGQEKKTCDDNVDY